MDHSPLKCPKCGTTIIIEEVNCAIFRCGVYKHNGEQIPPHLPKKDCDKLVEENKIWGCASPFKYENGKLNTCDYI